MAASLPSPNLQHSTAKTTFLLTLCIVFAAVSDAFVPSKTAIVTFPSRLAKFTPRHHLSRNSSPQDNLSGVIDLTDEDEDAPPTTKQAQAVAPFLSQGELSDDPNLLSPDFKDPKQTRVIIYIILTLVPVLFLVPLMIGTRDLIPMDALPPVELN